MGGKVGTDTKFFPREIRGGGEREKRENDTERRKKRERKREEEGERERRREGGGERE